MILIQCRLSCHRSSWDANQTCEFSYNVSKKINIICWVSFLDRYSQSVECLWQGLYNLPVSFGLIGHFDIEWKLLLSFDTNMVFEISPLILFISNKILFKKEKNNILIFLNCRCGRKFYIKFFQGHSSNHIKILGIRT